MAGRVQSGVAPPFDSLRSLRAGHAGRDWKTAFVGMAEAVPFPKADSSGLKAARNDNGGAVLEIPR